jgi:hypothetical protein
VDLPKAGLLKRVWAPALLLPLLWLGGCARPQPTHARVDPALAPLIPADTVLLAGMRIDRLKDTPFYKTYIEGKQIKQLEDFARQTGLDPRRDLWELVFVTNGKTPIVLVRGKFGGLFGEEPHFEGIGTERRNYKGYGILGNKEAGVMFMNASVAVAGPPAALERIVDDRDKPGEGPPQELLELVKTLPASSHLWVATTHGGALVPGLPVSGNLANLTRAFGSLQQAIVTADLSQGLDLHAEGTYPDAGIAKQIHDAARGFIGMGRLSTPDNQREMLRFYDAIKVEAHDNRVEVGVQAPFELLDKITKQVGVRPIG